MNHALQILSLLASLACGYLAARLALGFFAASSGGIARAVDLAAKASLYPLLATMGFRLGNDAQIAERLASIGLVGVSIAVLTLVGTFLATGLGGRLLLGKEKPLANADASSGAGRRSGADWKGPVSMLGAVAGGLVLGAILAGAVRIDPASIGTATELLLMLLLFLIGAQFAFSRMPLGKAFLEPEILLVPLLTAVGSISAGFAVSVIFGLPLGRSLAACAGFGWYSLSGVIIGNLGDGALGSAAFLGNILREAIAIALIPFLARSNARRLAIGAGGATAMDVTLPVIERAFGPEAVPESFVSGALLSLLVPVLVPFLYGLG